MIKKLISFIYLNVILLLPLSAQTVCGKIIDGQHAPLEGVTAIILQAGDSVYITGGVTNSKGEFNLSIPKQGRFLLQTSFMGYKKKNIPFTLTHSKEKKTFATITLNEDAYLLSGITVTAEKPQMELTSSSIVMNISSSILASQGNLFDALKRVPGIQIREDGTILINGQTGATIVINGKKTYLSGNTLTGYLQSIPASSIDKIELISSPSARYDASGKNGIIKIETTKNTIQGMALNVNTGYRQKTQYGHGNASATFQIRKNRLALSAIYAYYQGVNINPTFIYRDHTNNKEQPPIPLILKQSTHRTYQYKRHYAQIGVDYDLSSRFLIGAYISNSLTNRLRKERMTSAFNSFSTEADSTLTTWTRNKARDINYQGSAYLRYKSQNKIQWDTSFDFQHYNESNRQTQHNILNIPSAENRPDSLRGNMKNSIHVYAMQTDVEIPISEKVQFNSGIKGSFLKINNNTGYQSEGSNNWVSLLNGNSRFVYNENIYAGYIQLKNQIGKNTCLEVGVRTEHTHTESKLQQYTLNNDSSFQRQYTNLFPFIRFDHKITEKSTFSVVYTSRIVRPKYQEMNPYIIMNDRYLFDQGNVNLKAEINHQLELSLLLKKHYRILLFGSYAHHPISKGYNEEEGNRVRVSPLNLSSSYAYGLRLTGINLHPLKWWALNVNATCSYNKYAWVTNGKKRESGLVTPLLYLGNQFKFLHGWNAEGNGYWNGKTTMGQGLIKPLWSISLGISKSLFRGKASLRLFADDLFSSRYTNVKVVNVDQEAFSKEKKYPMIGISFSYKFQKGDKIKDSYKKREIINSKRINL